jgi:competence protein ComEA
MPISNNFRPKKVFRVVLIGLLIFGFCVPIASGADKVNINTGDKEQLMTLKGVGDALAERIIAYRQDHPFQTSEEIMNVKGIGEKIYQTNKDLIIVKDE